MNSKFIKKYPLPPKKNSYGSLTDVESKKKWYNEEFSSNLEHTANDLCSLSNIYYTGKDLPT